MITIIDYGVGNLGAVINLFKYINVDATITCDINDIEKATKILLPGVGAFDYAMKCINSSGLREILDKKVLEEKIPILGICLGMQILSKNSEEGELQGLGWLDATVHRFPEKKGLKIPHMGWNVVRPCRESELTQDLSDDSRFYFVHSYYVRVNNESDSILKAKYDVVFDAAVQHANIYGVQFHPEKSHKFGMKILSNFSKI